MDSKELRKLGYYYEFGIGVKKDEKKAFEYYMKAVELGNSVAMSDVSLCYSHGIGVEINYQKSFEYCKRSAELGNACGMCNVGFCYENGRGIEQDFNKAFECYKKAVNMGDIGTAINLARCYRNGIGTKKDIQSANYWFTKYRSLLKTNKSPDNINPELKRIIDDERFKLSWIDYNDFRDIQEVEKGGFATVYYGRWFDRINNVGQNVALKVIHDSNENEQEFIQELKNHCEIGYENPSFLECYGVSRNNYGDYIIVLNYAPTGSLRQNLVQVSQLEWKDKLSPLQSIALDLASIHSQKLVHRDLHCGNILQYRALHNVNITDFGLTGKDIFSFFKKKKKDPEELRVLGNNYEFGIGIKKDEKKALEYYMKAAELGNSVAMGDVGICYNNGIGVEINHQKSFQYHKKSADLGNETGISNVGYCYANGIGVDQDFNKAFEYYKKAVNMGASGAAGNLARYYRNGIGTKKDIQSANYWFAKYRSLLKTNKSPDNINPEPKRILDDERFKLSWIDYNDFRGIQELGKGGFATVYYARWEDRINNTQRNVALKVIRDSNENEQEFIQELKNYCEIGYKNPSFLECYGVSRNNSGDYIIVLNYASGSLRQSLVQVSKLVWKYKLNLLQSIALDLESIHSQELVHRDLHSGNILQWQVLHTAYITDLGLAGKVKEGKICGVLPYIAPEILMGQPYTQASDIYSLGVVMTEISTGQRAFDGILFDDCLASRIVYGSRPKCLGPDCYIKLAIKCMDKEHDKRPSATEIIEITTRWLDEMDQEGDNEIKNQILEADKIKIEPIEQIHSQDIYASKQYDTKKISEYFSKPISVIEFE